MWQKLCHPGQDCSRGMGELPYVLIRIGEKLEQVPPGG